MVVGDFCRCRFTFSGGYYGNRTQTKKPSEAALASAELVAVQGSTRRLNKLGHEIELS
jgi:hypothetical protein